MVYQTAYEFAQILPTTRKLAGGGGLLVLGSANVGEGTHHSLFIDVRLFKHD